MSGKLISYQYIFLTCFWSFVWGHCSAARPGSSRTRLGCVSRSRVTLPPRGLTIRWQIATHRSRQKVHFFFTKSSPSSKRYTCKCFMLACVPNTSCCLAELPLAKWHRCPHAVLPWGLHQGPRSDQNCCSLCATRAEMPSQNQLSLQVLLMWDPSGHKCSCTGLPDLNRHFKQHSSVFQALCPSSCI